MDSIYELHEIAQLQLDEAIIFYNQENYICAITLSGAAEDILSNLVKDYSDSKSMRAQILNSSKIKDYGLTYKELNFGRNTLKHVIEENCLQEMNIKHYAECYILLSIGDYFTLTQELTKNMTEFWKQNSEEVLNRKFDFESEVA